MTDNYHEKIDEVFASVLETLTFMFADQVPKDEFPQESQSSVQVKMSFKGPMEGSLMLMAPESICTEVAANILGLDEGDELAVERAHDALKELLNVTCGQLLTSLAGDKPVFDLSVPQITQASGEDWRNVLDRPDSCAFLIEDSPVLVQLTVKQAA